jgi:hypothetical protein
LAHFPFPCVEAAASVGGHDDPVSAVADQPRELAGAVDARIAVPAVFVPIGLTLLALLMIATAAIVFM